MSGGLGFHNGKVPFSSEQFFPHTRLNSFMMEAVAV